MTVTFLTGNPNCHVFTHSCCPQVGRLPLFFRYATLSGCKGGVAPRKQMLTQAIVAQSAVLTTLYTIEEHTPWKSLSNPPAILLYLVIIHLSCLIHHTHLSHRLFCFNVLNGSTGGNLYLCDEVHVRPYLF